MFDDFYVGRKVYYLPDDKLGETSFLATIIGIKTNWELGVRYYQIRLLETGKEITVRGGDLIPVYW